MKSLRTIQDSGDQLAHKTCVAFFMEIKKLFQTEDLVVISLCGGRSVVDFFKHIPKHAEMLTKKEWEKIHFFWTDENVVALDNKESNFNLCRELFLQNLLDRGFIDEGNIHRYSGEEGDVSEAYTKELEGFGGNIHIALIASGENSHIGALHPGHVSLESEEKKFLYMDDCPKPPPKRVTISPKYVIDSKVPFVFFINEPKRDAYKQFLDDNLTFKEVPCKLALEGEGTAYVITNLTLPN